VVEAEGIRAHLQQCDTCRAALAEIEGGDENDRTLAGDGAVLPRRGGEAPDSSEMTLAVEEIPSRPSMVSCEALPANGSAPSSHDDATLLVSLETAGRVVAQARAADSETMQTQGGSLQGPPPKPEAAPLVGVSVPGYDILEEVGRGGMGVVYKARHHRLGRLVALKMVLAGAHVGQAGQARFRAEAEAVAKVVHANIVQIYETGEHEGRPYFSLEYVEGGSLEKRLGDTPTTPQAAAQFVETLARAMDVAHQHGIVHRDLKPANILLARVGSQSSSSRGRIAEAASLPADHWSTTSVPKITDFGLAKRVDDDSSQTATGAILGTPSYMAPEQAQGRNREIGPAADIYSLGAILYELLTDRPPFKAGNPIDTIRQVIEQEPVPPRQLEPRVPHDLETICLKCLEKDPARRFATAAELADDLRRFLDGIPIYARPTPAWERAWKWGKRRPAVVGLMAVSSLAVLGLVLLIVWHNVSLQGKLNDALDQERRARQREQHALEQQRLGLVRQEGRKLFDSARVAVAAKDWTTARLHLVKDLATIGSEARVQDLKEPAQALLAQVEQELRIEDDRRASQARYGEFANLRDDAQFLGTLYTGMDLAANLEAARTAARRALAVYGVSNEEARPRLDAYLDESKKVEVQADCRQLWLILAETEAQSASEGKNAANDQHIHQALALLDRAIRLGAPSRAFFLRRARYLEMLDDRAQAAQAAQAAEGSGLASALDHFLMADELYRRQKFAEAIREFDRVLESKPGHFWAQYLNAICLLRQGRPAEARALLSACLAQRSDFVWLYLLRGFAQEELQAWDAADADFTKAARMRLDDNARYVLSVHRGVLRIRQERYGDAVAELNAATGLKPDAFQAFVNLARAYRGQGRLDQALEALDRAIVLEPRQGHLYRLRAQLRLDRHEPAQALGDFDQALAHEDATSPYRVDNYVERGRLLMNGGKPTAALASFDAALALRKDHSLAQRLRAECLFRLGRFAAVIDAFNRYLETGKPLESVYRGRGLARAELGQYPGAIEDFTKALELRSTSAVYAYRGWTHLVVDAPKLAERDFELAIELDPANGDAHTGRGFVRASQGRRVEALRDAADALRYGPKTPRLLFNAARIYAQCPEPVHRRRAVELLEGALAKLPADQRRGFWTKQVRTDSVLATVSRHPAYVQLEADVFHAR
jgi:serine/threonine protein kinase/tetratricopeptide (TPR) repeat protein